ncbi:MAG: tetratricopeptide repeat protein, partial [bacterium]|nr:tetratricopeptide repeat protein [bacterium]
MPAKLDTISRFSPGNCSPELLEATLVGRHDLVGRMEKSVLDSAETGAGHHWLLIGPRGTGKTHLLAVLHNRIDANEAVRSRFAIAYMKEEERGVASFLDVLVRILRAFHRHGERPASDDNGFDLSEKLNALKRMPLNQAQAEAERALIHFLGDRRLLLIAENLGEMFSETKGMGRKGQQRLRDLVQQHPFWNIVASSQALFEDVQAHKAPFYGFFKVHHLPMLTLEEANTLLRSLARLDDRQRLQEFFATEAGRGRIRAIHELTGGNPRLLVIFFQFVDRDSIEDLSTPFLEMIDNLTSYYQEQMHPLPALQQKIVEFLCEHRSPATVKEVAQTCFITHQTASTQFKRLAKRRFVQSTAVGREAFYELREPLFRICFEVKENMGYPIRLFVDFLGKFYTIEELRRQYRTTSVLRSIYESGSVKTLAKKNERDLGYIAEALAVHYSASYRELDVEVAAIRGAGPAQLAVMVDELFSEKDYRGAAKLAEAVFDEHLGGPEFLLKSARSRRRLGDSRGARERLEQLTRLEPNSTEAWIELARTVADDPDTAERYCQRALGLDPQNEEALIGLGCIRGNRGNHSEAMRFFSNATAVAPKSGTAWQNFGLAQENTGDPEGARASYERATQVAPADPDAWMYRGRFLWRQGDHRAALECFERVTELSPEDGKGWQYLGLAQENTGDPEGARASYERATQVTPDDPDAWRERGVFLWDQSDQRAALECFERVTKLRPDNGVGWWNLGVAQENTGDSEGARASYERVTELRPKDGKGWRALGIVQEQSGDFAGAEDSYQRMAELARENPDAWIRRAKIAARREDREDALRFIREAEALAVESASEFNSRGEVYQLLGLHGEAVRQYHRTLELDPRNCYARFNISLSFFQAGYQKAGLRQMEIAAETEAAEDWKTGMPVCIKDINEYLLQNTDVDHLIEIIQRQRTIFEGNPLRDLFIQGLTASLMELLRQHDEVPIERLIEIRDRVITELSQAEE